MAGVDEQTARKMGEVLAFAKLGDETFKKGQESLSSVLGQKFLNEFFSQNDVQIDALYEIAGGGEIEERMCQNLEKTYEKLATMRGLYLKEEDWRDATEIMVWLGFFEGAAIVHWRLILGLSEKHKIAGLAELANKAINFHQSLFDSIQSSIQEQ